jgi:transposase
MQHYAGIDVSLELSSVCVVDTTGRMIREAKVATEPDILVGFLRDLKLPLARIGLEAGPLSHWLHAGLVRAGFEAILLETRHVKAALSAIARTPAASPSCCAWAGSGPSTPSRHPPRRFGHCQEVRALLVARKLLQSKQTDVELSIRGILRGFGLQVGLISKGQFEARVRQLIAGHAMLEQVIDPMLRARGALRAEHAKLHRQMLALVRADAICRRLMTVPGVGALVAITFKSAIDDPGRFKSSKAVGAHFGLTPRKYQSGETDVTGAISKVGDTMVRTALFEAAHIMLRRTSRFSGLKRWAVAVAQRRGLKRAKMALARKLGTVLHRMWVDGTDFRWSKEAQASA